MRCLGSYRECSVQAKILRQLSFEVQIYYAKPVLVQASSATDSRDHGAQSLCYVRYRSRVVDVIIIIDVRQGLVMVVVEVDVSCLANYVRDSCHFRD